MPLELPILTVADAAVWRQWLLREGSVSPGVWLTLAKKGTKEPTSLTYTQALDEALCYGWIDGQARKRDEATYAQRFTPRTAKSAWSKRNVGYIARLEKEGRMQDAGREAVERAKADGQWEAAYSGPAGAEAPADFMEALERVPAALVTWSGLNKTNRYVIYLRVSSLKTPAGRQKRIQAFIDMLAKGETPLPQKGIPKPVAKEMAKVID
jgi:uncharacterized protein YdeI (YjbR/CyaY-like superfamily)